ncbi:hypothetical protein JCM5350_003344 [Sporobolomyces pararoseus]
MPHFSLALMKGTEQQHYRTKSEINRKKVKWKKHREGWYIRKGQDGSIVETKSDPPLIIAAGSILLALSVCSNISILLRLLDVHCRLFTFSTISILSVHIVLALITVTIFAVERANPDGYSLSTAFWLTVVSAIIALCVTTSLVIDGLRTKWYSRGGTGLTGEQRSLVIVFNSFIVTVLIGAIAYRYLLEDVSFLDSTYFSIQLVLTVGFGDLLPKTPSAQAFTIVFLTFAVVNFAVLLAFIRSTALEALKERYKARERRTLERIKTRHSTIRLNHSKRTAFFIYLTFGLYHPQHTIEPESSSSSESSKPELEHRAAVFSHLEGWSYGVAVYFTFVACSTLGLGDFTASSQASRAFFCIWALIAAGMLTVFFSVIADQYSAHYKETFQRNILARFNKPEQKHSHHPGSTSPGTMRKPARPLQTVSTTESVSRDLKNGVHIELVEKEIPMEKGEKGIESKGAGRKERVSELLSETRLHLQHLATRDSSDTETVDLVVRRVMDEEEFAVRNRELVEQDKGLKEFIFLRNLISVFHELETLTHELIDESTSLAEENAALTTGNSSASSRSLRDCSQEARKED